MIINSLPVKYLEMYNKNIYCAYTIVLSDVVFVLLEYFILLI